MELDHTLLPTHTPTLSLFLKGPNAPSVVEVGISAPLRCPRKWWSVSLLTGNCGSPGCARVIGEAHSTCRFQTVSWKVCLALTDPGVCNPERSS